MSARTGTGRLARLAVRRDRWVLPVWLVLLAVYTVSLVRSIDQLYPAESDRLKFIADTAGTTKNVSRPTAREKRSRSVIRCTRASACRRSAEPSHADSDSSSANRYTKWYSLLPGPGCSRPPLLVPHGGSGIG